LRGAVPAHAVLIRARAEALGIGAEVGQIAPGYSADLVAVRSDPLADIHALDAIEFVMKQGTVYRQ
jgi:imidazolonepropionase-like amidohydrolase